MGEGVLWDSASGYKDDRKLDGGMEMFALGKTELTGRDVLHCLGAVVDKCILG